MQMMLKKTGTILALSLVLAIPLVANAADRSTKAHKSRTLEVHIVSVQFDSGERGSIVAKPCDPWARCDNIFARIDSKTLFRNGLKSITYQEAKKIKWRGGAMTIDKFNNIIMLRQF